VPWLGVARLLAGVASGLVFAPGTAWVKELSVPPWDTHADAQAGARRPAVWLTAGFGTGPLVAGLLAEYLPHPLVVPYLPHLVVVLVAGVLVWRAPETVTPDPGTAVLARLRVRSATTPRFRGVVAPLAPWVFGAASISLTLGAALAAPRTGGFAVAFAGILAGLTLGTGVLVQPFARRLDARGTGHGATAGLVAVVLGCLVQALTAQTANPVLAVLAGVLLGAGYGSCLVAGLLATQRIAPPGELAGLTAVYYALTYVGFGVPLLLTALTAMADYDVLLLATAALALLTLARVRVGDRRSAAEERTRQVQ
jgi:MFS family permease